MASLVERYTNQLIARPGRSVPGAMLGGENIARVLCGKLRPIVERHVQRSVVRLQDYIRRNDFALKVRSLPGKPRILMRSHVPPRPAIEATRLHVRNVVGDQVVTEFVALVD